MHPTALFTPTSCFCFHHCAVRSSGNTGSLDLERPVLGMSRCPLRRVKSTAHIPASIPREKQGPGLMKSSHYDPNNSRLAPLRGKDFNRRTGGLGDWGVEDVKLWSYVTRLFGLKQCWLACPVEVSGCLLASLERGCWAPGAPMLGLRGKKITMLIACIMKTFLPLSLSLLSLHSKDGGVLRLPKRWHSLEPAETLRKGSLQVLPAAKSYSTSEACPLHEQAFMILTFSSITED
ncbi:uncharacterized protein LOC118215002 [Anguilla anguilla]|uniref:uncharacterized protein LOC118215002 n=1 Tax=Anguilla anguilla TaxID=7936 RepID=UPI0015B3576F|nr:uncharacterized protein LOC118215002 [Anguilla anguilla]